jgi:hypothetical protein
VDWYTGLEKWVAGIGGAGAVLIGAVLKIRKAKVDEFEAIIRNLKEDNRALKVELDTEKKDHIVELEKCQREHKVTHELLSKAAKITDTQRIEIYLGNRARVEAAKEIERLVNVIADQDARELAHRIKEILKEDIIVPTGEEGKATIG